MRRSPRPLGFGILWSFFAVLSIYAAATHASPPTLYMADPPGTSYNFYGETPDLAAQAAFDYLNSLGGSGWLERLQKCSFYSPMAGYYSYRCPFYGCSVSNGVRTCNYNSYGIEVWPRCRTGGAVWTGTDFDCPEDPQPGCDDSCK